MLEMNIKYNSHNNVLLPFWAIAVNFGGGGGRYFRGGPLLSGFNRRPKN